MELSILVVWQAQLMHKGVEKPKTKVGTLIFLAIIICSTLLRTPGTFHQVNLVPLWSWYQGLILSNDEIRWQIYFNILLFMPFGFFLYLSKASPLSRITLRGFLLSLSIEVCQYVFYLGLFEWDDMLHNSLGCLMGAACGKFIKTVWKLHRLHKLHGRKERE